MSRTIIIPLLLILGVSAAAASNGTVMECPQKEDNGTVCEDNNNNNTWICPVNTTCGNYKDCSCRKGFSVRRDDNITPSCEEINECNAHPCGANTECGNLVGSYYCKCDPGFHKDNKTEFCPDFSNKTNNKCEDIDECRNKTYPCAQDICRNTLGSYSCICKTGSRNTTLDPKNPKCTDIKECKNQPSVCGPNSKCEEKSGSYKCSCDSGYRQSSLDDKNPQCVDIKECEIQPSICGPNSTCEEQPGSYKCSCDNGYRQSSLDDKNPQCVDIKECESQPSVCGPNSTCEEQPGSYKCSCDNGYRELSLDDKNPQCVVCSDANKEVQCDGDESNCLLQKLNSSAVPTCSDGNDHDGGNNKLRILKFLEILGQIIRNSSSISKEERLEFAGVLLPTAEYLARILAILHRYNITLLDPANRISLAVLSNFSKHERVSLLGKWSRVTLDGRIAVKDNTNDLPMVGCLEYRNLSAFLEGATVIGQNSTDIKYSLVSPLISTFLTREDTENLSQPIIITLTHNDQVKDHNKTMCVFWSKQHNAWSGTGCRKVDSTDNETVCECSHMTSFAILLALQDIESWTLTLITQIGLSLSIICLTLALITFCFCRSIRGTRNTIHTHLCATLLLGNCIFLLGISATHSKVLCGVVAGVLHALYLSSFCWMALEGLELYLMLVRVFDTHSLKKRHLVMVGYGVPLIIIIISAVIYPDGYGTAKYCWLSRERGFIWSFMAPVCVIILANCCIFILTVWKLAEKMSSLNPDQGKLKRIRSLTVTSVAQLCILGCSWLFGFLMFGEATYVFAYIFSILNCLQGLQIFLLHCVMHKKVREEYAKWLCAAVHFKAPTYSEFSNTSNSHTNSKIKTANKESNL